MTRPDALQALAVSAPRPLFLSRNGMLFCANGCDTLASHRVQGKPLCFDCT